MSMLEDEDTETSMSESSTSTSDSESDDKYWKSHKKKGAEHCKQLSKTRKEKSTSRKWADSNETSNKPSSSNSDLEEEHWAKRQKETRMRWKDILKDRHKAIPEKEKVQKLQDTDEVEELVDCLAKMKVSDSDYAQWRGWWQAPMKLSMA